MAELLLLLIVPREGRFLYSCPPSIIASINYTYLDLCLPASDFCEVRPLLILRYSTPMNDAMDTEWNYMYLQSAANDSARTQNSLLIVKILNDHYTHSDNVIRLNRTVNNGTAKAKCSTISLVLTFSKLQPNAVQKGDKLRDEERFTFGRYLLTVTVYI